MQLKFSKYHGTGNDFIIVNNFNKSYSNYLNNSIIKKLCTRHFGIGADGLIILESDNEYDFSMRYFNSDGEEGSMCGNGGRCIVAFAKDKNLISKNTKFRAIDSIHSAVIDEKGIISLKMMDVNNVEKINNHYILNTGSPHYVEYVTNLSQINVITQGKLIRYNKNYMPNGLNVNFVEKIKDKLLIRTYERGVEDETISCGTGSVAAAITSIINKKDGFYLIILQTKGGLLKVTLDKIGNKFKNIFLKGAADLVFEGYYKIDY